MRLGDETVPMLRAPDGKDDGLDHMRCALVLDRWRKQDQWLIERDRSVEDACRMLMGDQWSIWSPGLNRRVNLADALGTPDLAWRELPKVNLCQKWYALTLARLMENSPILGAEPRDADSESGLLAQALDVVLPKVWDICDMTARTFEAAGWMAAAGWGFLKASAETAEGAVIPMVGPGVFPGPNGEQIPVEYAAYDRNGMAMGSIVQQEDGSFGYHLGADEQPGELTEGQPAVRALSPLECRGEWGNHIPWQQKRWHTHQSFQEPQEVKKRYGVDVQPDTSIDGGSVLAHYRLRLERGPGHYGVADARGIDGPTGIGPQTELVAVYEMWERPSKDFPEGRLCVVTDGKCLFDGPRPLPKLKDFGYTSPIVKIEWLRQAGRPDGTTPLSDGIPIQRQINTGWRQILLHRAKVTNPIILYDRSTGLTEEDLEGFGTPGTTIGIEVPGGAISTYKPVWHIAPEPLNAEVYRIQDMLEQKFASIMGLDGAEGLAQGSDASGEQVKELRFNSDRPISVPVKNLATGLEQVGNILLCILPIVWPAEKVVHYMGADNFARTMTILPEMWDGQCHVRINAESMLPRSRQEREAQALARLQMGVYGPPGTPDATRKYLEQSAYPDPNQLTGPDGPDRPTMNRIIQLVMQGTDPRVIPMLEQYNYQVMRAVLRDYMASPEFMKAETQTQAFMMLLWQRIKMAEQVQAIQQNADMVKVQGALLQQNAPLQLASAKLAGGAATMAQPIPPAEPASESAGS